MDHDTKETHENAIAKQDAAVSRLEHSRDRRLQKTLERQVKQTAPLGRYGRSRVKVDDDVEDFFDNFPV